MAAAELRQAVVKSEFLTCFKRPCRTNINNFNWIPSCNLI